MKKQYTILFSDNHTSVKVEEGTSVLEAMRLAGRTPDAPCGGNGKCRKCKVLIDGSPALACRIRVEHDMTVSPAGDTEEDARILMTGSSRSVHFAPDPFPVDIKSPLLGAVDIGTTTVAAYLMDGSDGRLLGMKSMLNPQRKYGSDVVSRCSFAMENGKEHLSGCIREAVNTLFGELTDECGCSCLQIVRIVFVGNTGMHHLFLELPVDRLALAPYEPYQKSAWMGKALDCQVRIHPDGEILWLPNIGGFVGADTVGCLLASGIEKQDAMTLMIDIGTNGEMALGCRDGLLACSTAAGPAFEGAKITCGMRGSAGAIDKVFLENGALKYHVIGGGEPKGICGSGLLDAAACLLKTGQMDETGRLYEDCHFSDDVFLNQKDIRELQLAKAAIAAGIRILCMRKGIRIKDIDRVLLAGAFGNYLDPDSACAIGLIPGELSGKIIPIGNAAGEGAKLAVLNASEFRRAVRLAEGTGFIELATDAGFQDVYVDELEF
ncbi:MAG: ASKHA domain-containing protein [Eubacteriales bacterium]|nr:ASKHA domain-containing protein [Eubacteriales bacterium]